MNTKLNMFCVTGYKSENEEYIFEKIMKYVQQIRHDCCYKFPIYMPSKLAVTVNTVKTSKMTGFFTKKEVIVDEPWYHYDLVFDKELTEDELNLWRMFKMGWRSRPPYRSMDF
jgi:hypothetical protein